MVSGCSDTLSYCKPSSVAGNLSAKATVWVRLMIKSIDREKATTGYKEMTFPRRR